MRSHVLEDSAVVGQTVKVARNVFEVVPSINYFGSKIAVDYFLNFSSQAEKVCIVS